MRQTNDLWCRKDWNRYETNRLPTVSNYVSSRCFITPKQGLSVHASLISLFDVEGEPYDDAEDRHVAGHLDDEYSIPLLAGLWDRQLLLRVLILLSKPYLLS